jgi:Na+-translocating ferredoxin:NAD+ oxidoreductase subunit G
MKLATAPGEGSARSVYAVMVGIALVAGLTIGLVFDLTAERVAAEHARLQSQAVRDVLPGAIRWQPFAETAAGELVPMDTGSAMPRLFAGYDERDRLVGFAIPAHGMGYQDRIGLLYGVDPTMRELLGLCILESRETPGLGARIADDPAFLAAFRGLAIAHDLDGTPRPLRLAGDPRASAGIDAITGATISSQAVVRIVSDSLARWWAQLPIEEVRDG